MLSSDVSRCGNAIMSITTASSCSHNMWGATRKMLCSLWQLHLRVLLRCESYDRNATHGEIEKWSIWQLHLYGHLSCKSCDKISKWSPWHLYHRVLLRCKSCDKNRTTFPMATPSPCSSHYCDAIMGTVAFQISSLTIVYTTVYSDADQSKHQSSASLAFVWRIHRRPVNSPHKWPVTRKMFPFDDVIMSYVSHVIKTGHWSLWQPYHRVHPKCSEIGQ